MQWIYIRTDSQVKSRYFQLILCMRKHLMSHIQHNLPVTCTAKRKQNLENTGLWLLPFHFMRFIFTKNLIAKLNKRNERCGHECCYQCHQHQHNKNRRRKDLHVIPNSQHNQLHQSSCIHQSSDIKTIFPRFSYKTGSYQRSSELTDNSNQNKDSTHIP